MPVPTIPPVGAGPRPRWSVMIPTCNDADLLPRALRSVLEQDPGPERMQIQVVDDASDDADVADLVRELAGDRVEVHRHPLRVGAPTNFTACAQRSRGRWVHILHADDFVLPGFYEAYAAHLDAHPAVMAVSRSWFVDAEERRHGLSGPLVDRDGYLVDAERTLALDNPVNFVAVVVAREALERLGGFRPDLVHANDWELWTRLAHDGPVAVVPGEHAAYRIHAGSDTNRLQRSMVYLTDPVAAARTITGRLVDPTERRDVARHVHRRLAEHALRVGADQAAAHEHRLAVTSAGWALRLSPDRRTAAAAAGIAATAVRNRLR